MKTEGEAFNSSLKDTKIKRVLATPWASLSIPH